MKDKEPVAQSGMGGSCRQGAPLPCDLHLVLVMRGGIITGSKDGEGYPLAETLLGKSQAWTLSLKQL